MLERCGYQLLVGVVGDPMSQYGMIPRTQRTQPKDGEEVTVYCLQCLWASADEAPDLNPDSETVDDKPYRCPECGNLMSAQECGMPE